MGKREAVRALVGAVLFGAGVLISTIPTLLLFPICLIPATIVAIIGIAGYTAYAITSREKHGAGIIESVIIGVTVPIAVSAVVGLVCLAPALLPGGIGYMMSKAIKPKLRVLEQF